jgi:hypothetical protein
VRRAAGDSHQGGASSAALVEIDEVRVDEDRLQPLSWMTPSGSRGASLR